MTYIECGFFMYLFSKLFSSLSLRTIERVETKIHEIKEQKKARTESPPVTVANSATVGRTGAENAVTLGGGGASGSTIAGSLSDAK